LVTDCERALLTIGDLQMEVMHNRQLLVEALWMCSCRRSSSHPAAAHSGNEETQHGNSSVAEDADHRQLSAEVAKHIAQTLVEIVTPDVMYNDIPWPDEDFVHVTIERLIGGLRHSLNSRLNEAIEI